MTMIKVKCEQCEKTFSKATRTSAEAALRMHVGRIHTKNIPTANSGQRGGTELALVPHSRNGTIDRRTKAWRQANPALVTERRLRRVVEDTAACFCPRCGLNLVALATAMKVAQNLTAS